MITGLPAVMDTSSKQYLHISNLSSQFVASWSQFVKQSQKDAEEDAGAEPSAGEGAEPRSKEGEGAGGEPRAGEGGEPVSKEGEAGAEPRSGEGAEPGASEGKGAGDDPRAEEGARAGQQE